MTWEELGIKKYQDYFKTRYWKELKEKLIYSKPKAQCWICTQKNIVWIDRGEYKSNLVIHHVSYENLGCEKLLQDVFILCHFCHKQVHFWGFGKFKTPRETSALLRRMYYLKSKYCFQKRQFIRSTLYFIPSLLY